MDEVVRREFLLEGVASQEVADVILDGIGKITNVESVTFDMESGSLVLNLVRQNILIVKLISYVIAKAGVGITISEVEG